MNFTFSCNKVISYELVHHYWYDSKDKMHICLIRIYHYSLLSYRMYRNIFGKCEAHGIIYHILQKYRTILFIVYVHGGNTTQ